MLYVLQFAGHSRRKDQTCVLIDGDGHNYSRFKVQNLESDLLATAMAVFMESEIIAEELEAKTDNPADNSPKGIFKQETRIYVGEQVEDCAEEESQPVAGFPVVVL